MGLIQTAYSGTAMETWVPSEAFEGCPANSWAAPAPVRHHAQAQAIPNETSCLWNAMVYPIAGYGIRAVLHNQIESNMCGGWG